MALFGKKKPSDDDERPDVEEGFELHPAKAARFFEHARTVQEATNYEYAMVNWLKGLAFDPSSMEGLEGFFGAVAAFLGEGKGKASRETLKAVAGKNIGEKYALALLAWGLKPEDAANAIKATKAAAKTEQAEPVRWLGERALALAMRDQKPKKDHLLTLLDSFEAAGVWDLAVRAGEAAAQADPSDKDLEVRVRNMSAQATMKRGGFSESGEEGGFRKNIRDSGKQRQLEEEDRLVKTEEVKDRLVREAIEAYRERPEDLPTIDKVIRALRERGTSEDESNAIKLATKTYKATSQFKYRQAAGEIQLRAARRKLSEYRNAAESKPDDATAQEHFAKATRRFTEMEAEEFRVRAENYPTDLSLKYELGHRLQKLGQHEKAIELFQQSQGDAKLRASSLLGLGECFTAIGWVDEAIDVLRRALEAVENESSDEGMNLRYTLMAALFARAKDQKDLALAEEADRLASAIAMQQIGFRDIRDKKAELKTLLGEIRGG
ncbi:MAG: tetratricopeptide repeat protein [Planctomycetota bacterium]